MTAPEKLLEDVAAETPDPARSLNNLQTFARSCPKHLEALTRDELNVCASLFAYTQFLMPYVVNNPDVFIGTLRLRGSHIDRALLQGELASSGTTSFGAYLRTFKKKYLLRISLRYASGMADIKDSMSELSLLADVITEAALGWTVTDLINKYGTPQSDKLSVIALGKLGARELNYSSDIDLLFVYECPEGQTSGVQGTGGIARNRITNHEFYCKTAEAMARLLSENTAEGFVYRVDLRLRPQGSAGELALPLSGYEEYYSSWGREWERLALTRARPIAGSEGLGRDFIDMVRPFVYRKYIDTRSFDEIRLLKKKIDAAFSKNDIKKGYGGIREIEFFAQALQLVYGGKEPLLRERGLVLALHRLSQKNLIGCDDFSVLSEHYLYLRSLEQCLQMLNDLQTHTLPTEPAALEAAARKMGSKDSKAFMADLHRRRTGVNNIYNSLFEHSKYEESKTLFDTQWPQMLRAELERRNVKNPDKVLYYLQKIKESTNSFQTLTMRRLQGVIIPAFAAPALEAADPEMSLRNLLRFTEVVSSSGNASYLELFNSNPALLLALNGIFSKSPYLSSILTGSTRYLDMLAGGTPARKTLRAMVEELMAVSMARPSQAEALAMFRKMEELRLGLLYLDKRIGIISMMKGLSKAAEAVLMASLNTEEGLYVAALGKLGGMEMTINSDLDIIFISENETAAPEAVERALRLLSSYTKEGYTYKVDTRLRADGSKGMLLNTLGGLGDYYLNHARMWEVQALLKARPLAATCPARRRFMEMTREVFLRRGHEITAEDIVAMRDKIKRERLGGAKVLDIKLSPGGVEDIEFLVQYLQLKHARSNPRVLVQNTGAALHRLTECGAIEETDGQILLQGYLLYRTIETLLRLRQEKTITAGSGIFEMAAAFLGLTDVENHLQSSMRNTGAIIARLMGNY
ncbi:MAG: bifunctional [glutamate--ammonia ligase]-adenylyl-L-tyrosine phosphorylase/[glutamate--ammonia-ligase] adenylyltransferase [Candidatus Magnetominusculus sp. LBB02]|nr:bifunctional [glutamate--ammonia ligase]-adenylyl-L-tyrosine phosphorylase/[glutamate--ammonia-ligase] adenylyltransferase [Candidatus Magnetominusculus sp. LBB02]